MATNESRKILLEHCSVQQTIGGPGFLSWACGAQSTPYRSGGGKTKKKKKKRVDGTTITTVSRLLLVPPGPPSFHERRPDGRTLCGCHGRPFSFQWRAYTNIWGPFAPSDPFIAWDPTPTPGPSWSSSLVAFTPYIHTVTPLFLLFLLSCSRPPSPPLNPTSSSRPCAVQCTAGHSIGDNSSAPSTPSTRPFDRASPSGLALTYP